MIRNMGLVKVIFLHRKLADNHLPKYLHIAPRAEKVKKISFRHDCNCVTPTGWADGRVIACRNDKLAVERSDGVVDVSRTLWADTEPKSYGCSLALIEIRTNPIQKSGNSWRKREIIPKSNRTDPWRIVGIVGSTHQASLWHRLAGFIKLLLAYDVGLFSAFGGWRTSYFFSSYTKVVLMIDFQGIYSIYYIFH